MKLNVDEMNVFELKTVVKMLIEDLLYEHDRISVLQDRMLQLELAVYRNNDIIK
jgi:hypothetical protein